jgi:hypothetical protein
MFKKMATLHQEYNISNVIVHGDMHANNLLFVKVDDKLTDKLAAAIDWQVNRKVHNNL